MTLPTTYSNVERSYVMICGDKIVEKIIQCFNVPSATIEMTVDQFRQQFHYPLYELRIDAYRKLCQAICVCSDQVVRLRTDQYQDSGIPVTAIIGNKNWFA